MTEDSRLNRALAGVSQGGREGAIATGIGMGLLPVMPFIRGATVAAKDLPEKFQARTIPEAENLISRLEHAAGMVPGKRQTVIDTAGYKKPAGHAGFIYKHRDKATGEIVDAISVGLGTSPTSIAHEMGHAAANTKLEQAVRFLGLKARNPYVMAVPAAIALSGALSDDVPVTAKAAPWLGGGLLAAILAEENRANIKGIKALKTIGHDMPLAAKLKMFAPTATYLAYAGALIGTPLGVLKGLEYYNKLRDQGRPPSTRDLMHASPRALSTLPTKQQLQEKWQGQFR